MRDLILRTTKEAMKAKDEIELSTLRLISAAIKEKDIELRTRTGSEDGIGEAEILSVLSTMIKQRQESSKTYKKGGRKDLAERELAEIRVIERFLPRQYGEEEIAKAIQKAIGSTKASSIKDMGKVMGVLKEEHAGRMDFANASQQVKKALAALV